MKTLLLCSALATGALLARAADTPPAAAPTAPAPTASAPSEWIDPATGHRIVRLSQEPGSASLYFHQNAYTPQGDKLIISTPGGLSTVNLKTREVELVVPGIKYGMGTSATIEVGRKTRTVYYQRNEGGQTVIYATDVDTKSTRQIAKLGFTGEFGGVSADETLIFGKCPVPAGAAPAAGATPAPAPPADTPAAATDGATPARGRRGGRGGGAGRMQQFFTVDIKSGAVKTFFPSTDNLNHDQCSPTDPTSCCSAMRATGTRWIASGPSTPTGPARSSCTRAPCPMRSPAMSFSATTASSCGMTSKPRARRSSGSRSECVHRRAHPLSAGALAVVRPLQRFLERQALRGRWRRPEQRRQPQRVSRKPAAQPAQNGQWMYLFTPQPDAVTTMKVGGEDVKVGKFDVEKLVDLSKQNYTLEPNLTFTPDDKWLVFRSNMEGATQVYAVEIAKAK